MYPMGAEEPALGVTRSTTGVVAARVVDGLSSGGFMAASSDPGVKRTEWTDEGECAEFWRVSTTVMSGRLAKENEA